MPETCYNKTMKFPQPAGPGLAIPEILLPASRVDLGKWAVIACDQYTQDRSYWEKAAKAVSGAPSALELVLPEIFLESGGLSGRIRAIHGSMKKYLEKGIFAPPRRGCVYLERDTPFTKKRPGFLAALDLEQYDYKSEARSLIRPTEGTLPERLPVRMDIRRGAPLEIPHILVLIDDEENTLLPGLGERAKRSRPAYETPLMLGGGGVSGWFLDGEADLAFLPGALEKLAQRSLARFGPGSSGETAAPFLYAAGDGNHSLAAAKEIWEEYKQAHGGTESVMAHPARWALAEIENLYDPAIHFEPIHRVVFNVEIDELLVLLSELPGFSRRELSGPAAAGELSRLVSDPEASVNRLGLTGGGRCVLVETSAPGFATVSLQPLLDRFVREKKAADAPSIDYIHGSNELFRLAGSAEKTGGGPKGKAAGILLPPVKKNALFETVARTGPLPRKSFSMGESDEQRFYLECRRLFN
jgi:hypothetical protein